MRNARTISARRGTLRVATVALALLAATLAGGSAPAATTCTSPPAVYPESQLTAGMVGTGYTTIQGSTPTTFSVEILGVMPDYIWLGIDAIVVRITGPQSFLDATGGVFYGMSGSPVYIGGKLVGAVSYGVSYDPTIFGLTPAQTMVDLFGYAGAQPSSVRLPQTIPFDDATKKAVARALGIQTSEVTSGLERLPTYMGVSGLSAARLAQFQRHLDKRNMGVVAVPSSSMDASLPVDSTPFSAGQPVGSVLSWGDFTVWAAGTVAVTCGDSLVAYGHSLFGWPPGATLIGMTGVNVLAVGNGAGLWPGDMVPVLTTPRGAFVQDRFTGEVGTVGAEVPSIPITSSFSSPDTGLSRDGETDAIYTQDWWFPEMVWGHMVENLGAVLQQLGKGTLDFAYTVQGTREDGTPFTVSNRAMAWSDYDATYAVYKLVNAIDMLQYNQWGEQVSFTGIDASGSITKDRLEGTISSVRVSSPLQPTLRARSILKAAPGDRVTIEVKLDPISGGKPVVDTLSVKVPRWASGMQAVMVRGGRDRFWLRRGPSSFDELVAMLSGGSHGNDLIASAFGQQVTAVQPIIVDGKVSFAIEVIR